MAEYKIKLPMRYVPKSLTVSDKKNKSNNCLFQKNSIKKVNFIQEPNWGRTKINNRNILSMSIS